MGEIDIPYPPVKGKTYSLFGNSVSTHDYYQLIRSLVDEILLTHDIQAVLESIRRYSSNKRALRRAVSEPPNDSIISFCLNTVHNSLKQFTTGTREHLANLPLIKRMRDRRLGTTEEQYHLYMLEIELTNRLNKSVFLSADRKICLQPYCLQDFTADCKADKKGFDYQCKGCSSNCFQNQASKILRKNNVESYIWMGGSIRDAAGETYKNNQTLGILGIACIPELAWGMRKCHKNRIPAIGIPLNANRCIRWFGEFHPNSVDLGELENLLRH
jgi:hypothetical protein